MNLVWTATAARNRDEQLIYIGQDNPSAALRLDLEIDAQIGNLRTYAIYRIRRNAVQILRLLHGAQQWP